MKFDTVQTQYGTKLVITWPDGDYPDGIKQLPWEDTHRSYHKPNGDGDSILDGKVDEKAWHIDCTERAITLLENRFDTYVPNEFKPDDVRDDGHIDITVPEGYSKFFLQNPPTDVDRMLDSEFSYEEPDAEYTTAYQNGTWDGMVHIYNTNSHGAPVGLLDRTVTLLKREGYKVDVTNENEARGANIDTSWHFPHDLRPYQTVAVGKVVENEGGLVSLPTGTGKTITALKLIHLISSRSIVMVHTKELLYQWADEIRDVLGVEPGIIGDGEWSEGPVTVAIMQTLLSQGTSDLSDNYDVLIFDECHRTSAAEQFHEIGMELDCYYRIGLSATPWRKVSGEELKIEGSIGGVAHRVTAEEMIEEGYLARPEFDIIDPAEFGEPREPYAAEEYHEAYRRCIELDPIRTLAIADKVRQLVKEDYQVLINVNRIAQGRLIAAALNPNLGEDYVTDGLDDAELRQEASRVARVLGDAAYTDAVMLSSGTPDRDEILEDFDSGEQQVVVSTLLKEGVDIPDINAIVLAHGQKSDTETIQTIGRALRPSNGKTAQVIDVKDRGRYFSSAYNERQDTMANYYGRYHTTDYDEPAQEQSSQPTSLTDEPPEFEELFE